MSSSLVNPPTNESDSYNNTDSASDTFDTCVVFMLGYPGMGKRTVGEHLAKLLDGVLVDNALINRPLLELFRWDGVELLPPDIWDRVIPIRQAVLRTIEEVAPRSNSYVFTNVIEQGPEGADEYNVLRSLAHRRGSLFLSVMLTCDIDVQVNRIDNADRVALRKGSHPDSYRWYTQNTTLYEPPPTEVISIDTTETSPADNARKILGALQDRGLVSDAVSSQKGLGH